MSRRGRTWGFPTTPHAEAVQEPARRRPSWTSPAQVGLDKVFMPMGSNFGDIDNDGFLDIYLGTGNPSYGSIASQRAAAQPRRQVLCGCDGFVGHRRVAQGPRRGVCRHGQRRRPGHCLRGRRRHSGRCACASPVRESRPRPRLDQPDAGRRQDQPPRHGGPNQGHRRERRRWNACDSPAGSGAADRSAPRRCGSTSVSATKRRPVDLEVWWPTSRTRAAFREPRLPTRSLEIKEFAERYTRVGRPRFLWWCGTREDSPLAH